MMMSSQQFRSILRQLSAIWRFDHAADE